VVFLSHKRVFNSFRNITDFDILELFFIFISIFFKFTIFTNFFDLGLIFKQLSNETEIWRNYTPSFLNIFAGFSPTETPFTHQISHNNRWTPADPGLAVNEHRLVVLNEIDAVLEISRNILGTIVMNRDVKVVFSGHKVHDFLRQRVGVQRYYRCDFVGLKKIDVLSG